MKRRSYNDDVPRGGRRKGSGRKPLEAVQLTARVRPETLEKLRAEATRRLEPGKKQVEIGKVIDELAEQLPEEV